MPLRDHFRPPLRNVCRWESFHGQWAGKIVEQLNAGVLPEQYAASPFIHLGLEIAADVGAQERHGANGSGGAETNGGGIATAPWVWAPPLPAIRGPVDFAEPDLFEVQIVDRPLGNKLVAVIELVSPANKDRPANRRTFAIKCASYLSQGVSVIVVDLVTLRLANLHNELVDLLDLPAAFRWQSPTDLSIVSYRTLSIDDQVHLDVCPESLAIGSELPTAPLWLAADLVVPVDFEQSYLATFSALRLRA
jgi:hypothetical protein